MRLTEKGQVTIPIEIRQQLGMRPGDELEFTINGSTVVVQRAKSTLSTGQRLVERLRGRGDVPLSTDEIMALTRGIE